MSVEERREAGRAVLDTPSSSGGLDIAVVPWSTGGSDDLVARAVTVELDVPSASCASHGGGRLP